MEVKYGMATSLFVNVSSNLNIPIGPNSFPDKATK